LYQEPATATSLRFRLLAEVEEEARSAKEQEGPLSKAYKFDLLCRDIEPNVDGGQLGQQLVKQRAGDQLVWRKYSLGS
jgi:hypothetical protein